MLMRRFKSGKLVRDSVPKNFTEQGLAFKGYRMELEDFKRALIEKLFEEASEIRTAKSPIELVSEMADVLEILNCLARANEIKFEEVEATRLEKLEKRGSFDQRFFETEVEIPDKPSWVLDYVLGQPEKYPEIKLQ